MLDIKDFSIFENQVSFDFKGFLIKIAYWKWFQLVYWLLIRTLAYRQYSKRENLRNGNAYLSKEESNLYI
jgi:hypothetical protein